MTQAAKQTQTRFQELVIPSRSIQPIAKALKQHRRWAAAVGAIFVGSLSFGAFDSHLFSHSHVGATAKLTGAPVARATLLSSQVKSVPTTARPPANAASTQLVAIPGFVQKNLTVNGVIRHYYLQTPGRVNKPVPLVIALHGMHSTPTWIAENTGLSAAAKRNGVALVVPVTVNGVWNDGRLGSDGPADQAFITQLAQTMVADNIADSKRVVITGFSNGAEMSLTLASTQPGTFAAVVSVSGELPSAPSSARPQAPIPAFFTHGLADQIQPYSGRPGSSPMYNGLISEDQTVANFVRSNNAQPPTTKLLPAGPAATGSIEQISYPAGVNGASVTLVKIPGMGHRWPAAATHRTSNDSVVAAGFDATALIMHVATTIYK